MNYGDITSAIGSSGGAIGSILNPKTRISFLTSQAERAANSIYSLTKGKIPISDDSIDNIKIGLDFLIGDSIWTDIIRGGYQPHIGAYMAHLTGDLLSTGLAKLFQNQDFNQKYSKNYQELLKKQISKNVLDNVDGRFDPSVLSLLETFGSFERIHPKKFREYFHNIFKSGYVTGERFVCVFEEDGVEKDYDYLNPYPNYNRHYLSMLVKSVTIPTLTSENITFNRFGQNLNIAGNSHHNDALNVTYLMDYNNVLINKLMRLVDAQRFASIKNLKTNMYIMCNHPLQYKDNIKDSIEGKHNILFVYKFHNISIKNINQYSLTADAGGDFLTLNTVINFNNLTTEIHHHDFNNNSELLSVNLYNSFSNKHDLIRFNERKQTTNEAQNTMNNEREGG